jgi:ABC-type nitrate/sulfonate/bicarbonate transport system permease component
MSRAARLRGFALRWAMFAVLIGAWELVGRAANSVFFPPPSQIWAAARAAWFSGPASSWHLSADFLDNVPPGLGRMLLAWGVSSVVGIMLGIALGRSPAALDYVGPLLAFLRAIPPPTLVPVFLVLLRLGPPMQLATIVFGVIWPVLINTIEGARSVDQVKTDTVRAFRLPRRLWVLRVVLPAALPKIFAGLRISLSLSLILMVVSELVASTNGLGYLLSAFQAKYDYAAAWAVVALIGLLGYAFNSILLTAEHRLLRTRPGRASRLSGG